MVAKDIGMIRSGIYGTAWFIISLCSILAVSWLLEQVLM